MAVKIHPFLCAKVLYFHLIKPGYYKYLDRNAWLILLIRLATPP